MSERNFHKALKEADRARSERTLPPDAERRIRARVDAAFDRRRRFPLPSWTLGLAGAMAAAALVVYAVSRPPEHATTDVNGFVAESGALNPDALVAKGDAVVAYARAELVDRASRIHVVATRGTTLKREARGVRVMSGKVEVSVEKRHAGEAPAQVFVSDGVIEILGTRFTIDQAESGGGQVTLHEGSIRFRAADGREQMMVPGETLSWPLAPHVALAPIAPAPAAPSSPEGAIGGSGLTAEVKPDEGSAAPSAPVVQRGAIASTTPPRPRVNEVKPAPVPVPVQKTPVAAAPTQAPVDVDALIEDINVLRRRGQFSDAAARLEAALEAPLPEATSERLSYELGSILTWQLKDAARGCKVWKAHRAAHPAGRYAAEIRRAESSLACP